MTRAIQEHDCEILDALVECPRDQLEIRLNRGIEHNGIHLAAFHCGDHLRSIGQLVTVIARQVAQGLVLPLIRRGRCQYGN